MQGASLWPILTGKADPAQHNIYHGAGLGELLDLESDPGEFDNLWRDPAQHGRRFALLRKHLDAMMATSSAGAERVAMY